MAEHPLGWVEHKLAWGRRAISANGQPRNPAIVKIGDTLFVHGGVSAEYSKLGIDAINRRVAAAMAAADDSPASVLSDPLGPLWYRGLVARDADAETERAAAKPPAPHLTADQELDLVLPASARKRMVIGHTPSLKGIRSRQRPPRAHRYRQFDLLWRAAQLARDQWRSDGPAHGAAVAVDDRRGP